MYAITKYTDTSSWGVSSSVSFYSDKDSALDAFASIVQEELFFLDEEPLFEEFIEKHSRYYSFPVSTLVVRNESLRLGTYPEWMIVAEYFDWVGETYRIQMVECVHHLSITL